MRYDPMAYRRAKRSGRERGCWTYIPAEELLRAGLDPSDPPPWYTLAIRRRKHKASGEYRPARGEFTLKLHTTERPPARKRKRR